MNANSILIAREERLSQVFKLIGNDAIILIKANMPGRDKNNHLSYFFVSLFFQEVKRYLQIGSAFFFESDDGPYYIIQVKKDLSIKDTLIEIENLHPLGRMIDLDFFMDGDRSISRLSRGHKRRSCVVCGDEVVVCMRMKRHSEASLMVYFNQATRAYLQGWVKEAVSKAMLTELSLEHKFGLVTFSSRGSHPDMDYALMKKAQSVIWVYLVEMFFCGYDASSLDAAYLAAKVQGIKAEEQMLLKGNGINTYKGLIFVLGFALVSTGFVLKQKQTKEDCFENIKKMAKDVFADVPKDTFGGSAYHRFMFGGVRQEVSLGLPSVRVALDLWKEEANLHSLLVLLVGLCEDSVLLKRAKSMESYLYFKNKIKSVDTNNLDEIVAVTNECISHNISCGGSADLMVTTLYMKQFITTFLPNL